MSKRYDDPIEVEVGDPPASPAAFNWRGRRYSVHRLLKHWREAGEAWDSRRARDYEYFRVEADGGTYDLLLDRLASRNKPHWRLRRVWD